MTQDAEFYFKRSDERYRAGDVAGGNADLNQAILLAPDYLEYRWKRGTLRYQAEEHQLAVEDVSKIVALSADIEELEDAYRILAISHEISGLNQEWLADLDWLVTHNLANASLYSWRGSYWYRVGSYEKALADFTKAVQSAPGTPNNLIQRSNAYAKLKCYEDEINDLGEALAVSEFHEGFFSVIFWKRAIAYFRLGNKEQAFADYDESVRLSDYDSTVSAIDYFAVLPNED